MLRLLLVMTLALMAGASWVLAEAPQPAADRPKNPVPGRPAPGNRVQSRVANPVQPPRRAQPPYPVWFQSVYLPLLMLVLIMHRRKVQQQAQAAQRQREQEEEIKTPY